MTDALRFEWARIRTIRSTYWLFGLGLVLTAAIALILAIVWRNDEPTSDMGAAILTGGADFATFIPIFIALVGIFATGHEYRYGTIQPTLTALPQRSSLLLAKVTMVIAFTVALAVLSMVVN